MVHTAPTDLETRHGGISCVDPLSFVDSSFYIPTNHTIYIQHSSERHKTSERPLISIPAPGWVGDMSHIKKPQYAHSEHQIPSKQDHTNCSISITTNTICITQGPHIEYARPHPALPATAHFFIKNPPNEVEDPNQKQNLLCSQWWTERYWCRSSGGAAPLCPNRAVVVLFSILAISPILVADASRHRTLLVTVPPIPPPRYQPRSPRSTCRGRRHGRLLAMQFSSRGCTPTAAQRCILYDLCRFRFRLIPPLFKYSKTNVFTARYSLFPLSKSYPHPYPHTHTHPHPHPHPHPHDKGPSSKHPPHPPQQPTEAV